jgi:hypothetical protein
MTVVVSFITSGTIANGVAGIGRVRAQERVTIPGTTVATAQVGETVIVGNGETSMVAIAWGAAPDAAAVAENLPTTTAGYPVGAGMVGIPFVPGAGAKINVKAVP